MHELDTSARGRTPDGVEGAAFGEAGSEDSKISVSVEEYFFGCRGRDRMQGLALGRRCLLSDADACVPTEH